MRTQKTKKNVRIPDIPSSDKPLHADDSKTLRRGLQVMDALLAGAAEGLRVVDLCRITALERTTVHRLLATLIEARYVAPVSRFRYGPGERWEALMPTEKKRKNLAHRIAPVLAGISDYCGDAAFAVVREGSLSLCIARHVGSYPIQILVIQVGTKQPLGVGAAGLALLSAFTPREIEMVIDANKNELAIYGNMSPDGLRKLVCATHERGWSVVGNHATKGVLAVGMPIFDTSGCLLAGISVASTEKRMSIARQKDIVHEMRHILTKHNLCWSPTQQG